jgi:hypothetical protein
MVLTKSLRKTKSSSHLLQSVSKKKTHIPQTIIPTAISILRAAVRERKGLGRRVIGIRGLGRIVPFLRPIHCVCCCFLFIVIYIIRHFISEISKKFVYLAKSEVTNGDTINIGPNDVTVLEGHKAEVYSCSWNPRFMLVASGYVVF